MTLRQRQSCSVFITQTQDLVNEEPLIPDKLPISKSIESIKKIALPSTLQDFNPAFMLHKNFKILSNDLNLQPSKDSRVDAANLLSMSVGFKKKPFLRQVDIDAVF